MADKAGKFVKPASGGPRARSVLRSERPRKSVPGWTNQLDDPPCILVSAVLVTFFVYPRINQNPDTQTVPLRIGVNDRWWAHVGLAHARIDRERQLELTERTPFGFRKAEHSDA
jgi:hypothetical protein